MAAGNLDQAQNLIATMEGQRLEIERYLVQQGYGSEL